MAKIGSWIFCLTLILGALDLTHAEGVSVSASISNTEVGVGDVVRLTVSIQSEGSTAVEAPQLPKLAGLDLINTTSGTETRSTYENGRFLTQQSRNFIYMLAVSATGQIEIPPLTVMVDGKPHTTEKIVISANGARSGAPPVAQGRGQPADPFEQMDEMEEIFNQMLQRRLAPRGSLGGGTGQGGHPGTQQNLADINPQEAFFIHAETDKQQVYVGEQVTASFYLYTQGNIRDIDTLKYPDLKSFWKEELEMATRLNFEQVSVNGRPYQRAMLVSYALFPIKAGKAIVDPYKAKCTVITPTNFGFGRPYVFTKASRPIPIEVLNVPIEGKPANYSGAVGQFRLTAAFEPPAGQTNQPVTLRVRFEGRGNAKLIELPKLDLPPSFELYDQKSQAKYLKYGTSFKEFEVLLIPREPGIFELPQVKAAVFDPALKTYSEVTSAPLKLTVSGTASAPLAAQDGSNSANPQPLEKGPVLPGLVSDPEIAIVPASVLPVVTGSLYLLVLSLLSQQGWAKLRHKPKRANLNLLLQVRLKSIRALAAKGEWRRVGVELTNATYFLLGQLTDLGGASQELDRMLEATPPSLRAELSQSLRDLVSKCETLSFAPEAMIGDLSQKPKLKGLVDEFERVMKRALELAEV